MEVVLNIGAGRIMSFVMSIISSIPAKKENYRERAELNSKAEDLLTRYGTGLFRFAYSYLHNEADAEEREEYDFE